MRLASFFLVGEEDIEEFFLVSLKGFCEKRLEADGICSVVRNLKCERFLSMQTRGAWSMAGAASSKCPANFQGQSKNEQSYRCADV